MTRRPPSVQGVFAKPEAQVFADVARSRNVPDDAILIEDQSTNTGGRLAWRRAVWQGPYDRPHLLRGAPSRFRASALPFRRKL